MRNKEKTNWVFWLMILIGIMAIVSNLYTENKKNSKLMSSHAIIQGQISSFGYNIKSSRSSASFFFKVGKKVYQGSFSHSDFCQRLSNSEEDSLKHVKFPVIYYPKDPKINMMLLKKWHYEKFNVPYPKDLEGVLEEYFGCSKLERFFTYW
jgi:hypothetical protein